MRYFWLLLIAGCALANPKLEGEKWVTVEIQPATDDTGALDGADSYLKNEFPNNNFGGETAIVIGRVVAVIRRAVVRFDWAVTDIPADVEIAEAVIVFKDNSPLAMSNETWLRAHALLVAFTEAGVTWNDRDAVPNAWGTAGIGIDDVDAETEIAGEMHMSPPTSVDLHMDITKKFKEWYDVTLANNGMVIYERDDSTTQKGFLNYSSKESATALERPYLRVRYKTRGSFTLPKYCRPPFVVEDRLFRTVQKDHYGDINAVTAEVNRKTWNFTLEGLTAANVVSLGEWIGPPMFYYYPDADKLESYPVVMDYSPRIENWKGELKTATFRLKEISP